MRVSRVTALPKAPEEVSNCRHARQLATKLGLAGLVMVAYKTDECYLAASFPFHMVGFSPRLAEVVLVTV
jgi:hypothetical protein